MSRQGRRETEGRSPRAGSGPCGLGHPYERLSEDALPLPGAVSAAARETVHAALGPVRPTRDVWRRAGRRTRPSAARGSRRGDGRGVGDVAAVGVAEAAVLRGGDRARRPAADRRRDEDPAGRAQRFMSRAASGEVKECQGLARASGLGGGCLPEALKQMLLAALDITEAVIARSLDRAPTRLAHRLVEAERRPPGRDDQCHGETPVVGRTKRPTAPTTATVRRKAISAG